MTFINLPELPEGKTYVVDEVADPSAHEKMIADAKAKTRSPAGCP